MQAELLKEILDWSAKQPAWQRDALRRLFTGALSAADMVDLFDLCKAQHGLSQARTAKPLANEHLAITYGAPATTSLVSVTHHSGVNALAPEQTIAFGAHLTIVYGQNGAGKSGYTRILRRACRARFSEEILGNVAAERAPTKGQATIRFLADDSEQIATWTPDAAPNGALAAVSVFDSECAPVYLREKTDVAFRPFGLDVFDKLSVACADLRKRLESEQAVLSSTGALLPKVAAGTKVASLLAALTLLPKPDDIRALATLSNAEEDRLKALRTQQRDLQTNDPKKKAQELELKANRVEAVASHATTLGATLDDSGIEALRASAAKLGTTRAVLAHLRQTVLTADLLAGTGQEAWRKMWDAAGEFSGLAYPGKTFPVTSADAKCVLCQQPLGEDGGTRFKHFQELVASTAQADVRAAENAYSKCLKAVADTVVERADVALALEELQGDDEVLAERARSFLRESEAVKRALERAIADKESLPAQGVRERVDGDLRSAANSLRERAVQLRKQTSTMDVKDAAELNELEARVTLNAHLSAVLDEIERQKRVAAYAQCIEDTGTQAITRKSTELTKRLVTERLRQEFQAEVRKVDFTHLAVEIKTAGGAKGTLFHQLTFSNAPGIVVAKVLSEGESRTLSLAAFLAELSTSPVSSAIIFDDPVSSLDHIWRERIGRRLVLEAKTRQVIVFTHDLVFLKVLVDECGQQDVAYQHRYVRRDGESSGVCSTDLPWVAMRVKERLGVLRQRWQAADKLSRTASPDIYEREARDMYGLLREAWEQATGEVLLADVIERYRPSIETKKVRNLHDITGEDCAAVEAGMTECSRWIRGHDHPPADAAPFPKPSELSQRIQDLEEWVQRIRKRREGKKGG